MIKYPKRVSEILSQAEINTENLLKYGNPNPWAGRPDMQEHCDQLQYIREAMIARALGMDMDKVDLNCDNEFYKKYLDRVPEIAGDDLKKLTAKRNDPNRYITSHIWGYDQSNVEIAEWVGSFNGLQVFINGNKIFLSRPGNKRCWDYPQVRECGCISYDLNPRSYEECFAFYSRNDDPHNGYYR